MLPGDAAAHRKCQGSCLLQIQMMSNVSHSTFLGDLQLLSGEAVQGAMFLLLSCASYMIHGSGWIS